MDVKAFDRAHLWHPYASVLNPYPMLEVASTQGVYLHLADGRKLIDGMSSWWSAIHGYGHPRLVEALQKQAATMSHVMFGGLTHAPAARLGERLLAMHEGAFDYIFYADSGSVAVEVAMKMALQYRVATGERAKSRFLALRGGYHGDTFGAMSVCDPVTGMHTLFRDVLPEHLFAPRPVSRFGEGLQEEDWVALESIFAEHADELTAVILEPIVQGAGGVYFYDPAYLRLVRRLCDRYDVLLIFDEIATGFGRTGELFAYRHAGVVPDILCLGKALTGGMMTLAATLTTRRVAEGVEAGGNVLMHGPTFMANPLACAVAEASLEVLVREGWRQRVADLSEWLESALAPCADLPGVKEVRVLGAVAAVEMERDVDLPTASAAFAQKGVWIRPFMNLIYLMPPYISAKEHIEQLGEAIAETIRKGRY